MSEEKEIETRDGAGHVEKRLGITETVNALGDPVVVVMMVKGVTDVAKQAIKTIGEVKVAKINKSEENEGNE